MDVTIKVEKTFLVSMTETQARTLLNVAIAVNSDDDIFADGDALDVIDDLRIALLNTGILKDPKK